MVPSDEIQAERVADLKAHRTRIETPDSEGMPSIVEMFFARIGVPQPGRSCLTPVDSIVPVDRDGWPLDTATEFRMISDASAEIYLVEEHQSACGGGSPTTYRHYFRASRTVMFERRAESVAECSGRSVAEVSSYFYGPGQELIAKEYSLVDSDGRRYSPGECTGVPPLEPYWIAKDYSTLLRTRMRGMTAVPG